MRHTFIRKAKKNSYLMDLIDRYKKWRLTRGDDSETDSGGESGGDNGGEDSDTDWNMTVKGAPPPSYTDSLGYSQPINSVASSDRISNGDSISLDISPARGERSSRSRSPEKQIVPSGLSPAKSEQQIVSSDQVGLLLGFTNIFSQANSMEMKRESRSMDNLNTAVENRAKEEERKREEERRRDEERRHNEENERRRRKEEEKRKGEERKVKEERRKSGARDSRERSPSKQVKSSEPKEERRRDSKGERPGRRQNSQLATINPLLSEVESSSQYLDY